MPFKRPGIELLLIILGTVLMGIVLLAHGSISWYEEVAGRPSTPNVPQVLEGEGGMISMAWIDKGEVASDSTVRIWIQVENHAQTAIEHLRLLAFHTPGFQKVGPCWKMDQPSCRPGTPQGTAPQGLPVTLKPGESSLVYADLGPATWYGSHSASGVLSWQDAKGTWARAVVLPAVQIVSPRGRFFASVAKSLDLLKDLALPLVLVVFGSYLQNQAKKREDEKADRDRDLANTKADRDRQLALEKAEQDKKLADKRAELDREHAQVQETWRLMLPKVSVYAEQHYMPIESSIATFRDALEINDPVEGHLQALFNLLLFLRRMQFLADETGGLFFRDLEGEELAGELWRLFRERAWEALERKDYARAMTVLSAKENYADFLDKLEGRTPQPKKSEATRALLQKLSQNLNSTLSDWRRCLAFRCPSGVKFCQGGI